MKTQDTLLLGILILCVHSFTNCKKNPRPNPELASIGLFRGDLALCGSGQFGEVSFSLACDYETRADFDLAVSLLHSFEYVEAEKAFVNVIDKDPECAMAYWGVAMSNFHPLWSPPSKEELEKGSKILKIAATIPKSERSREYLDAVNAFYTDWETLDHSIRIKRFESEMEQIYNAYPDDKEAAIFYALALKAAADITDKNYTNERKAGAILEALFPDQPDHPGIAHYIIHNYDNPVLAEMALPTARRYAEIAPASAHAQHMPSHIFTRLGLWEESINSNLNSTSSAVCYASSIDENAHWDEEVHGMGYLVYAYLQKGDNDKAQEQFTYLQGFEKVFPANFKIAYTTAAIPSRIALENRNWATAAELQLPLIDIVPWDKFPWERSIMNFAKALGAVHLGDTASAENELKTLKSNRQELIALGDDYKANQVEIQINTVQAWLYMAEGQNEQALSLMQKAVEMESITAKHPVTPGEVLPAVELLGDMLLAMGKSEEALAAYELDLKTHPNRFNGLYGAAKAAKESGNREKMALYFGKLLEISSSKSDRTELEEAKKFLNDYET